MSHLFDNPDDIVLSVDYTWSNGKSKRSGISFVSCDAKASQMFGGRTTASLKDIGSHIPESNVAGEWIGLLKLNSQGSKLVVDKLKWLYENEVNLLKSMTLVDFLKQLLLDKIDVSVSYYPGYWLDLDSTIDPESLSSSIKVK